MKIVHVYYSLNYGGIESLLVNITKWQVKQNYDVSIILLNKQKKLNLISSLNKKVKLIELKRNKSSLSLFKVIKLNYVLLKNNFDIIHIHAAEIGNILLNYFSRKIVLHIHATSGITNTKIPNYKRCIAISKAVNNVLINEFKIYDSNIIYNGIDFDSFDERKSNKLYNKIVCIGNLNTSIKNQNYIINEFDKIKDKISSNLYIIGVGDDYKNLLNLISMKKINNRVFLIGNKSQKWIKKNLCKYDLFLQASLSEGLGITAIESSAASLPMILSNVEGHLEISNNGKYCELFNPRKTGELSNKILKFYNNPKIYFQNSKKNRTYLKNKFDLSNFNIKIIQIYKSFTN